MHWLNWRTFLALAVTLPAASLSAQDTPAGDDDATIVVTGQAEADEQALREAVRAIAERGRSTDRPNAQFQTPLCVTVSGLDEQSGAAIKRRIEDNTRDAGVEVAGSDDCQVNALVIVVDDQIALINRLRKSQPNLFSADIDRRIKIADRRNDAAISWAAYRLGDPQGKPLSTPGSYAGAGITGTETVFESASGGFPQTRSGGISRSSIAFSSEKVFSVVVFDIARLIGVHLDQVADYSTMHILADPQPNVTLAGERANSILTLFAGSPKDAPLGMTDVDRAFLRGLYAMRPNDPASQLERFVLSAYEDLAKVSCPKRDCEAEPKQR